MSEALLTLLPPVLEKQHAAFRPKAPRDFDEAGLHHTQIESLVLKFLFNSGIASGRVKIATYAVSGLLAGIAAVLYVAQYRQGKPDAGAGLELDAIAAVVIGGTSLMGGRGSMAGTFCGVLIFGLLSNILQLHNINSNLQLVLKGLIIIGTVLVQERNAADLLSFLRLSVRRPAQKDAAARKRPPQETATQNIGGNTK